MTLKLLASTATRPIADRVERLCMSASEIWLASAFVTTAAMTAFVEPALRKGRTVRLVTGTYGNFNRKAMFARGLRLSRRYPTFGFRVWAADGVGDFHAKLYLWKRHGTSSEAWIGSSNFTDWGLNNEGELVLVATGSWGSGAVATMRERFSSIWREASSVDDAFVRRYRQAPRTPPDSRVRSVRAQPRTENRRVLLATVAKHFDEGSSVVARVDSLFPRSQTTWIRCLAPAAKRGRRGDLICLADRVDRTVSVGLIREVRRDGRAIVVAYSPGVVHPRAWNETSRRSLRMGGVVVGKRYPRLRWLDGDSSAALLRILRSLPRRRSR